MSDTKTPSHSSASADAPAGVAEALRRSDLFGTLPDAALHAAAADATLRAMRRGERLWDHGTAPSVLGVVASGRVKCWSRGHDSRQWVSSVVRPGGVCGLAACVDGGPYTCNAEPIERSRVVFIPRTALLDLMQREPAFGRRVALTLAGEFRRVVEVCEDVTLHTPLERLAHYLQSQAAVSGVVELRETQTQIAAQLGTVREVVGRGFRCLATRGVIARSGRVVRVLRPGELAQVASGG